MNRWLLLRGGVALVMCLSGGIAIWHYLAISSEERTAAYIALYKIDTLGSASGNEKDERAANHDIAIAHAKARTRRDKLIAANLDSYLDNVMMYRTSVASSVPDPLIMTSLAKDDPKRQVFLNDAHQSLIFAQQYASWGYKDRSRIMKELN